MLSIVRTGLYWLVAAALLATWLAVLADPAPATFPGKNGKILYSKHGDLWIMKSNGARKKKVTDGGGDQNAALAPNGKTVAAQQAVTPELHTFKPIYLPTRTTLAPPAGVSDMLDPAWHKRGKKLAFAGSFTNSSGTTGFDIFTIKKNGQSPKRLTNLGQAYEPAWSPNGKKIAFVQGDNLVEPHGRGTIYVMRANGKGVKSLSKGSRDLDPNWSPDGKKIVFTRSVTKGDKTQRDIFVMRKNGKGVKRLTRSSSDDNNPAWSPDGKKIVFDRAKPAATGEGCLVFPTPEECEQRADIYVMDRRGKKVKRLTKLATDESEPEWQTRKRRSR